MSTANVVCIYYVVPLVSLSPLNEPAKILITVLD